MKIKKTLAVFMAALMMISAVPFSTVSATDETIEDVLSDAIVLEEYDSVDGDSGSLDFEEVVVDGEEDTLELDEESIVNNLNMTNGIPESEVAEEVEAAPAEGSGEQVDTEIEEFTIPKSGSETSEERTAPEGSYETNASSPYLTVSSSSVKVNAGSSAKVTIGYGGFSGRGYVAFSLSNSKITASWGSWNGNKIPINIAGASAGTAKVTIYLKRSSDNKTLASKTISVTVTNNASISLSKNNFDTVYNKTTQVNVTVSGVSSGKIRFAYTKGNSVTCSWGSWSGNSIPLNIKGTGAGTSKITVSFLSTSGTVLTSKTITVNVTRSATLKFSATSLSPNVGSTSSVNVSYSNAYGNIYASYSINNSVVSCSWSGWTLKIGAKRAGTATVTIRLYNSSNDLLATRTITVNVKNNASIKCNVSSVSLQPGAYKDAILTFSGTSEVIYYNCSIANSSICSTSWTGNWSGNSHALRIYGKNPGTTKITVSLRRYSDDATLATVTISVTVTGTPTISLSTTSSSLKVGDQTTIVATAKNVSGAYQMAYGTSGTCFSCSWSSSIVNNKANLTIKGTKAGTGTLTVCLIVSGKEVSKVTCKVTVKQGQTPTISFSQSTMSLTNGTSSTNWISCSGTSEAVLLSYSLSNNNISALWGSQSGSALPLKITAKKVGTTTVTIKLLKKSNRSVLATKSFVVTVSADTGEIKLLSYNFDNYSPKIPLSTFRLAYGNTTKARSLYDAYSSTSGVCYGMAATAMMFRDGSILTPSTFGKSSILSLSKTADRSSLYNMNLNTYIELMYITQFSTISSNNRVSGIDNVCKQVAAGNRVLLMFWGPYNGGTGGHAVVAYMLDEVNNRLYISDSNYPGGTVRYISLTKNSSGKYTGWSYNLFGSTTWNNNNGSIAYQNQNSVNRQWQNRGNLQVASGWLTNMLLTNSDEFKVYDVERNLVATYSDGVFNSELEGACYIPPISINPNAEYAEDEYNLFYLPAELYVIENLDKDIESFKTEMISEELGVKVETAASMVTFSVDDSTNVCSTNLSLNEEDVYSVTLMSSREGEDNITVNGIGVMDDTNLNLSMTNGVLSHSDTYGASISINDEQENYYTIEASATEGGTISPEGIANPIRYENLSYTITPDVGYVISDVLVDGESVGVVNEYTFSQIESDATIEAIFEKAPDPITLSIKDLSVSQFNYGDKIILHASAENLPHGAKIVWETSNSNAATVHYTGDGKDCTIECVGSGEVTITAKVVNEDGTEVYENGSTIIVQKTITAKSGFFQKIISFFKNLFKINRVVAQSVLNLTK